MAIIQVRAADLFPKHWRDLIKHSHHVNDEQWARLVRTEPSRYQGMDILLDDGCRLQCCFPDDPELGIYEVKEQIFDCDADWVRENVGLD